MKTSIFTTLGLCLLYFGVSYSQPLAGFEDCNCANWDDACFDNCLLYRPAESNAFSNFETCNCEDWDDACFDNCLRETGRNAELPCGLIRICQRYPTHHMCTNSPRTIPPRCGPRSTTRSPWPTRSTTPRIITTTSPWPSRWY